MENRIIQNNKILIQELCNEHNKLRKNPESYIGILKKVLNLINIKLLFFIHLYIKDLLKQ